MKVIITCFMLFIVGDIVAQDLYFPPAFSQNWETIGNEQLGWCDENIDQANEFLSETNTKAFIILKDGKIALESYFDDHEVDSPWYWASAGKSLTAVLTGMIENEGLLNIDDSVSDYLGEGWTVCSPEKEMNITIRNQLTMTTGLDFHVEDRNCTDPECLSYLFDPNAEWYYHNAPYSLIPDVLTSVTGESYTQLTNNRLATKLGFLGLWTDNGFGKLFHSTARSMARFGLLMLAKGNWDGEQILEGSEYFSSMLSTSQEINEAYGYLWWLNGGDTYRLPSTTVTFQGALVPDAPEDLHAAIGKNGQICIVVPSENLVIVRMGDNPDESLVPINYLRDVWQVYEDLECSTSVHEEQLIDFNIYPRLTYDNISIETSISFNRIDIIDRTGRVVITVKDADMLDVSSLYRGIYYVRIISDKDSYSKRFVKL